MRADPRVLTQRFAQLRVTRDGLLDAIEQILVAEGLLQEVEGPMLHGLDCHRDVAVAGHENHRDGGAAQVELLLKLEAAHAGHADVEHQAAGLRLAVCRQEFLRGGMQLAGEADGLEQRSHGVANAGIVIDHDHLSLLVHARSSAGCNLKNTQAPRSGDWPAPGSRTPMVPRCDCMMVRLMASPRPVPDFLVVAKGWNS